MAKNHKKVSLFEIIYYSICGAFLLWGLTYLVLGFIAGFLSIDAPLYQANKDLHFIYWGSGISVVSVIAFVIVLLINAKKSDIVYEKEQKRAQRLASIHANSQAESPVVDAEVSPAESK